MDITATETNTITYSYNAANRLLSSVSASETNSYSYDVAGRLTNQTVNAQSRSYEYSFRGQMTSLTDTNGTAFSYDFDGDGNRISASVAGCLTSRYVYDGPNVVLDLNASNEVVHAYVQGLGIDQPIERIAFIGGAQSTRLVYHTDGLGSVVVLTDSGQQTAKSYTYEAFGRIRSEGGNALVVNRYTYTAREAVGDSLGLYYYRWRVMDPNAGRFTSEDPWRFVDGANMYRYVKNAPTRRIDAWGLTCADLEECYRDCSDLPWWSRWACRAECRSLIDCDRLMERCAHFRTETECQECCDEVCAIDIGIVDTRCREQCYLRACACLPAR
jgi:RHS repeat-associated protein